MVIVVVRDNQVRFPRDTARPRRPRIRFPRRGFSVTAALLADQDLHRRCPGQTCRRPSLSNLTTQLPALRPPHVVVPKHHPVHHACSISPRTPPEGCRVSWVRLPAHRISPFPTTARAGAGCPISGSAALPARPLFYSNLCLRLSQRRSPGRHACKHYAALLAERTLNPAPHAEHHALSQLLTQCSRLLAGVHDFEGPCAITEATAGSFRPLLHRIRHDDLASLLGRERQPVDARQGAAAGRASRLHSSSGTRQPKGT